MEIVAARAVVRAAAGHRQVKDRPVAGRRQVEAGRRRMGGRMESEPQTGHQGGETWQSH
ncbi:MAG: hypothetical protein KHZ58_15675 [Hungatella hathewayi]|nr:hypothetical protein [Hungatella hathewayi]